MSTKLVKVLEMVTKVSCHTATKRIGCYSISCKTCPFNQHGDLSPQSRLRDLSNEYKITSPNPIS